MQGERVLALLKRHIVRLDPVPFALPLAAEEVRQRLSVDDKFECARADIGMPRTSPVLRPHPDVVLSAIRDKRRLRVGDGLAESVREEIRRAHLVHELGVVDPSTIVLKPLRLDLDRFLSSR